MISLMCGKVVGGVIHGLYILIFLSLFFKNVKIKLWHHKLISEKLCETQKNYLPFPQESYVIKHLTTFFLTKCGIQCVDTINWSSTNVFLVLIV